MVVDALSGDILARHSLTNFVNQGTVFDNHPNTAGRQAPTGGPHRPGRHWLNDTASATRLTGANVHAYSDENGATTAQTAGEESRPSAATGTSPVERDLRAPRRSRPSAGSAPGTASPRRGGPEPGPVDDPALLLQQHLPRLARGGTDRLRRRVAQLRGRRLRDRRVQDAAPILQRHQQREHEHARRRRLATNADVPLSRPRRRLRRSLRRRRRGRLPRVHARPLEPARQQRPRNGLLAKQSRAMGEGWSDWFAADFLVEKGFEPDTPPMARSARRVHEQRQRRCGPHPRDRLRGRLANATRCPGRPGRAGGYTFGDVGSILAYSTNRSQPFPFFEEHAEGELWAQTLWDLRKAIGGPHAAPGRRGDAPLAGTAVHARRAGRDPARRRGRRRAPSTTRSGRFSPRAGWASAHRRRPELDAGRPSRFAAPTALAQAGKPVITTRRRSATATACSSRARPRGSRSRCAT